MPDPTASAPEPSLVETFGTSDGIRLFMQAWLPDEPRATLVLVHGYAEHSGRYGHVAGRLRDAGIATFAYDQRGHGRSPGARAFIGGFERLVDDLDDFLRVVKNQETPAPLFLMGHSMGGTVVLLHALERSSEAAGLVLSSPAIRLQPAAPGLQQLAPVIGRLLPHLPTIRMGEDRLSHDPDVVRAAETDPLYYSGRLKARTGAEIQRAGEQARRMMDDLRLPFLVLQGTGDDIADPAGAEELYARATSGDKTIRLYDGLYHEPLNEHLPDRRRVLDDVMEWLKQRCDTD